MQAFLYRHLVPAEELLVAVSSEALARRPAALAGDSPTSSEAITIPCGGTVRYQLAIPKRADLSDLKVELSNPPDGITILRAVPGMGGMVMLFSADAEMTRPGLKGHLTLNVYTERTVPGRDGRPRREAESPHRRISGNPL